MPMQLDLFSAPIRAAAPVAPAALSISPEPPQSEPMPRPSAPRLTGEPRVDAPAEQANPGTRRITDAGEHIERARKDFYRQALCVADLARLSGAQKVEQVTKDAVWPTPDYAAAVEDGMPVATAALIKILRDSLPIRPRLLRERTFDHLAERYVTILGDLRDACAIARTEQDVIDACAEIQRRYKTADVTVVYKGRYTPLHLGHNDRARAKRLVDDGFPGDREGWKRGYVLRRFGGTYEVCKSRRRISDGHASEADAWAWVRTHLDAQRAVKKADAARIPSYPHLTKLDRTGPEQRTGVGSDDFRATFGFRGVQFGNWLPDAERQAVLDHAYAGLLDLADITGIPPNLLALGGRRETTLKARLGIAFGARGRGGRTAAHYEPGEVALNMTKFSGAGRVSHEFWHALDHWLAIIGHADEIENGEARFATGTATRHFDRTRALPDLPKPIIEGIHTLLKACLCATPSFEDAIARARNQIEQASREIRELTARAEGLRSAGRGGKPLREATESIATWTAVLDLARERDHMLCGGQMPPSLVDSQRSRYRSQALILDPKSKAYWSTPCELTARGFEAWCHDRLAEQGRCSQYLVHSAEEGLFAPPLYKADIYPAGAERQRINGVFDELVPLIAAEIMRRG